MSGALDQIAAEMTPPAPPGVHVAAGAVAGVDVQLGRVAAAMEWQARRRDRLVRAIHTVPVIGPPLTGSGTIDSPDLLGPHDGYIWDLRRLTCFGFSAGTVNVYVNDPNGEQLAEFTSAGQWAWGKAQAPLQQRDRLIAVASGITGNVRLWGTAVQVEAALWGDYLL